MRRLILSKKVQFVLRRPAAQAQVQVQQQLAARREVAAFHVLPRRSLRLLQSNLLKRKVWRHANERGTPWPQFSFRPCCQIIWPCSEVAPASRPTSPNFTANTGIAFRGIDRGRLLCGPAGW